VATLTALECTPYAPPRVEHSVSVGTKGLPRDLTSFVGRRRELGEIRGAMSASPLLTLIGPAGVGKTRLALRAAPDISRAFPDGVCLVELAELRDPTLVAETVAGVLGLRDASTRWVVSTLADYLGPKRMLLILDNCEHLADACAILADGLLRACPDLKILATSREPLGIDGETVIQVPPLPFPDEDRAPPPADAVVHYDAVRLFVERARSASSEFEVTPTNAADVVALCRRLDGLPLALELAAVRLRAFTVGQILEQLDQPFQVLSTSKRTGSPRHQSLGAAIEWSYGLLSAEEQVAWRRLSVFAGSFDLEAAAAILDDDLPAGMATELLAGLVDKSILRRELRGDSARFRMLETIRDFGRERLRDSGDEGRIGAAYRAWFTDLASMVFEHSWGASQLEWWDRAHPELPNVRDVLRACLAEPGTAEAGLLAATNLFYYWLTKGSLREGRRWIDAFLELAPERTTARAKALAVDGWLAQAQGDMAKGMDLFVEAEQLASALGDEAIISLALVALSGALIPGDLDRAAALAERCLEVEKRLPDRRWAACALAVMANVCSAGGDPSRASDLYDQAADLCRQAGDRFFLSRFLPGAGLAAWHLGDLDRARILMAEAIRLSRSVDDKAGMAIAIELLAWIGTSTGGAAWATRLLGGVQTLWESIPAMLYPQFVPQHDASLADARSALGDREFDRIYRDGRQMTTDQLVAWALEEQEPDVRRASAARRPGDLTAREFEIAGLVAQGLSNKEIASALVISQRTAETHVEHILTKLGFSSRAQIAAWVAERRAPQSPSAPVRSP
jgi:predicted ATPase/DNA-binding CsgD family transcriptional regulator